MRKHYAVLLLTLAPWAPVLAQITVGQNEMPHANDQLVRVKAVTNPFVNYGATGAAYNWNFASLSAAQGDTVRFQSVASTNFLYAIVYADIFFNPNRANMAKGGVDIPFSNLLPIANPYTFNHVSSSQFKAVGMGAELSGLPVPITFDQQDVIYQLPLQFGNSSSSHSSYHVDVPNVGYYGFQQDRLNTVDGWGAITTPGGSWDVLRVKTTLTAKDSIGGLAINRPVVREYKWLAQGLRVPVLQINTTSVFGSEVVTGIWYYDVPRTLTVEAPLAAALCPGAAFNVYFLATGSFNAGGIFIPANQFRAQLSDAAGNFSAPVTIGTLQGTTSSTIAATIPANTPPGTGYKVRVVSTSPGFTGAVPAMDIAVGGPTTASISADASTQLCTGGSVLLTAVGGPGYQWYRDGLQLDGATAADYVAVEAGNYSVVVSNDCGSATSGAITVMVSEPPVVQAEMDQALLCANGSIALSALDMGGQAGNTYQWYLNNAPIAGAVNLQYEATMAGQYEMQVMDPASGCTGTTAAITVSLETLPATSLTADGPASFCSGGSVELGAANTMASLYEWSLDGQPIAGAQSAQYVASAPGTYAVVAISANGCSATPVDLVVTENGVPQAPVITADGNTTICAGDSVGLTAVFDGVQLDWYLNGDLVAAVGGPQWTVAQAGSITATATNAAGCTSAPSNMLDVIVAPAPVATVATANGAPGFCAGDSVVLIATVEPGTTVQWWRDGSPLPGATGTALVTGEAGTYAVVVTSDAGCSAMSLDELQLVELEVPEIPVVSQTGDMLVATGSGAFQWFLDGQAIPGATDSGFMPVESGSYAVVVTNAAGCSSNSAPFSYIHTGIANAPAAILRIMPNPNRGRFVLEIPPHGGRMYEVHDLSGKALRSGSVEPGRNTIDLGTLAEGAYFLRVVGGDVGSKVLRFVVQ